MSQWYDRKREDISLDGEDVNIYVMSDDFGAVYVTVKVVDLIDVLGIK